MTLPFPSPLLPFSLLAMYPNWNFFLNKFLNGLKQVQTPNLVRLGKFLSLVLRHRPEIIAITPDKQGWVEINTLLSQCQANGKPIDRPTLEAVVATNNKKRYLISEDGLRIRANQGHSIPVELDYEPITPPDEPIVREAFRHRIAVAWIDGVVRGGIHCISVYLIHSVGLSPANDAILEELFVVIRQLVGPWIIAGDWNVAPQLLAASQWLLMTEGVIFAPTLPTCNSSVYDYFVVQKGLAGSVAGVQRIEDGGASPHFFARLLVRGDARRFPIRKLVTAPRVSGSLPFGPAPEPPSYSQTVELAKHDDLLGSAMEDFYTRARAEWTGIAGKPLDFVRHRFKMEAPLHAFARPWTGASTLSVVWRSLARRADEVPSVIQHHLQDDEQLHAAARRHVASAAKAYKSLCNSQQESSGSEIKAWAASLAGAWSRLSARWAQSLAMVADTKAKKLEAIVATRRAALWRSAVGQGGPSASAKPN